MHRLFMNFKKFITNAQLISLCLLFHLQENVLKNSLEVDGTKNQIVPGDAKR